LWVWVKRLTIAAALLVTAALLATNREAWLPHAQSGATVVFKEVDRLTSKAVAPEVPPAAVEAAHAQNPQLRADTITLVMERANLGGLEPLDVFRRATEAAQHGRAGLGQAANDELDALGRLLAEGLPEAEGRRLVAYQAKVKGGAITAPYEDQEAMWLTGRAARNFAPDRLARLQELLAQAVAAGLPPAR
jgi:hypothetical protein